MRIALLLLLNLILNALGGQSSDDDLQYFNRMDSLLDNGEASLVLDELAAKAIDTNTIHGTQILHRFGRAQLLLGNYPKAINALGKTRDGAMVHADTITLIRTHLELARAYRLRDVDTARCFLNVYQASALAKVFGDTTLLAASSFWEGIVQFTKLYLAGSEDTLRDQYAKAAHIHFSNASSLYRLVDKPVHAAEALSHRGEIFDLSGQSDSALYYAENYLRTVDRLQEPGLVQKARIRLAIKLMNLNQREKIPEALDLWRTSLTYARKNDLEYDQRIILYNQAVAFWRIERYDSAYAYQLWYTEALEAAASQEKSAAIAELEVQYETAAKEAQLTQQGIELRRRRKNQGLLFFGLIMLAGGAFSLYHVNQRLRISNAALQAQQDENEVLRQEVHHRVKNNLQVMASLLQLGALREQGRGKELLEINRGRILAMGRLHERLMKNRNSRDQVDLGRYLEDLCAEIRQLFPENIRLEVQISAAPQLDGERAAALGLILNELITNALRHAFSGGANGLVQVSGTALPDQRRYCLRVADDGVGQLTVTIGNFGSELINLLVAKIGAELSVASPQEKAVTVVFPY